ncbi:oxidoreductase [Sporosarcina sp. NCCP-2716]|uniref:aldo/keto reductase n=1 Tax=Sporosarcina sp. NCCP-2716 TaxID=2943679 RepID=UPI00203F3A8A|nr:aldo/keto reductase [Sporosarcina sp. NCCP-2716]GKV67898.1 oxidoreductase [Sporosarcina sp. NCCP-2716]
MKKREVGRSGLFVSELGLGCMSLPEDQGQADRIIASAIDAGVNLLDTADLYGGGTNEELVGRALKGRRQEVILATKAGNRMNADGRTWSWDPSKEHIMEAVKASLTRLGTDYIDLYQLHGGTIEDDADETIEAFERLKEEGVIRQYGISSIRPNVIDRFLSDSSAVSVMMQYSMLDRRPEEWFDLITGHSASVIARGPLAKGLLTAEGPERVRTVDSFAEYGQPELTDLIRHLDQKSTSLHAAAIHFCLSSNAVASVLTGARTLEQLDDSLRAYETAIPQEELQQLTELLARHSYAEHRI